MFGRRDKDGGITGRSQYRANLGKLSVRDQPPLWNQQRGDYQNSDISLSLSSLRGSLTGWRYRLLVDNSGKGVILDPKKHQHTMATTIPESSEQETGEADFL